MPHRPCAAAPILLVGGGGHCRAVIDVLDLSNTRIAGIVHGQDCALEQVLGYPSLGRDSDLPQLRKKFSRALVTVGQIKTSRIRQTIFTMLQQDAFELPVVISPLAYVSRHAAIGLGSVVMHQAMVNAGVSIGENCIINSKSLIEHDCTIASHCHIAVGAILCGGVTIGEGSFVGAGAILKQEIHIGNNVVIGCGVTVHANVPDNMTIRGRCHE